jgi:hypothetical protein
MTTTMSTGVEVPRDRWQRPMVRPPGADKNVPYTRCTTFVSVLEDTYNLGMWQQRMVALGLNDRPDLLLSVSAHRDDKDKLNKLVDQAREAAAASAGATTGTALHALTEQLDRGQEIGAVPEAYRADLDAYQRATQELTAVHIERFTVLDDYRVGGTPDRIVEHHGKLTVADVKTGSIEYGIGKIAMQLAVYAHSMLYDPQTYARTPLDGIDLERAVVIHLPAGQGRCELVEVDISAGWEAVQIAKQVRDWRSRAKYANLARQLEVAAPVDMHTAPAYTTSTDAKNGASTPPATDALAESIATADSVDALTQLWRDHQAQWTPEHTKLAAARKNLLSAGAVA